MVTGGRKVARRRYGFRLSRVGVFVAFVMCALVAGCDGGDEEPLRRASPPPALHLPLSERELAWIRGYSVWAIAFWDDYFSTPRPGTGIRRVCLEPLEDAGKPPSGRLRSADVEARRVCERLASGSIGDAEEAAEAADEFLLPLLVENQRLPVGSGAMTESRIDLMLGGLAARLSGAPVEARCWKPSDWERLIGETNVWAAEDDDPAYIDGRADVDGGRMHLRLEHCNILVTLGREDVSRRSREGLIDAGVALSTFAHEIGHFAEPEASEAEVECRSYALLERLGAELGVVRAEVDLLEEAYREVVAPTLPNEYRDPDCEL